MSYPQPPAVGGFPAPYPGGIDPEPRAGPGTAIAAGILAALGGAATLCRFVSTVVLLAAANGAYSSGYTAQEQYNPIDTSSYDSTAIVIISAVGSGVIAITLTTGCILLFIRKAAGRILVACGAGAALVTYTTVFVAGLVSIPDELGGSAAVVTMITGGIGLISALPAVATLILALVPPTGRWIRQGKKSPNSPQQGFPQQGPGQQMPLQGYPQQMPAPGYQRQQWW